MNSSIKGDYKILIVRDVVQELRRQSKFIQAVELIDKMKKEYPVQSSYQHHSAGKTDQSHFGFPFL
ncbi:hypothetical protein EJ377_00935 [Chryseobacterium arthrosphaerae]|uniref:Uncharacterized protein n=1 Tax=Chryseobacterium arthrosphaerae TaxID=651561 RepID=A0A432DY96_9FLAO|nr:hypothetical protein EJ377_00935 [Chryseobacterium arthrosphaerae]